MTQTATEHEIRRTSPTCIAPFLYVQAVVTERPATFPGIGATEYVVGFHWTDTRRPLDRPQTHSISTGGNRKLALRLATAVEAGRVHSDPEIRTDVDGHTYVGCTCAVMGKYLNADLRRLGF